MEIIPLIWLLFAIAAAVAANSRNRFWPGYFILGFFIGPFSLLLALVAGHKKPAVPPTIEYIQPPNFPEPVKTCTACAETIKLAAVKCKYCGQEFDPDITANLVRLHSLEVAGLQDKIAAGEICPACHGPATKAFLGDGSFGPWCPACRKAIAEVK